MDPEPDTEALRRRLYRPDASAADLASYLHAAEAQRPAEPATQEDGAAAADRAPLRPFVIGAACVAGAAVIGGLLLGGVAGGSAGAPTATPSATVAVNPPDVSWQVTFVPASVIDGGSRSGAQGAAVQEGPDRARYSIAQGDTVSGIAARFGLCRADVIQSLPYGFSEGALPAGAMLELGRVSGVC